MLAPTRIQRAGREARCSFVQAANAAVQPNIHAIPVRPSIVQTKELRGDSTFAMIANIRLTRPESLIFYPAPENNLRKNADRKALHHPEDRLWKLSTQIASPEFTLMESFVMLVLAMLAFAVLGGCLIALSQLLQADAIQHIVVQAVQSPAAIGLRWP